MENPVSTSTTTEDAPAPLRTTHPPEERLGTLSFHLDGAICRVNCEYCYLGARPGPRGGARSLDAALMEELIKTLPYKEVAVSLSEPAEMWAHGLKAVIRAARNRDKPVAVTTTLAVARNHIGMLSEATRVNLSVDPAKGPVNVRVIAALSKDLNLPSREVSLIVTLSSPTFCDQLASGMLQQFLELPTVDAVALNGIKPPPPWLDKAYWLQFLSRIQPLVDRYLDRRLFSDCYVHARILGLGPCPGRPDISPGAEFRSCVYQKMPDFEFQAPEELAAKVADYLPPAVCPFKIV